MRSYHMIHIPRVYTVESVTSGHPDKVCDQISDAVLDACLAQDPGSRVAVETFGSHGLLVLGGEVTSRAVVPWEDVARRVYKDIGYTDDLKVITNVVQQSPDIAQGVDTGGAGDQGIMYGYATDETPEFLPRGVVLAHKAADAVERLRRSGELPWLMPDGKTQVTIADGRARTFLMSVQHRDGVELPEMQTALAEKVVKPLLGGNISDVEVLVNPTGRFVCGGFEADTGLTGRKIMVDTYGGLIPHGGGCFSGKDPTKVDRSGAYMARFAAKNIVANGYAKSCLVSVAYAIGRAEPVMMEAHDENGKPLGNVLREKFDFRPRAIIERLRLREPHYAKTACYGHFGRDGFPWEERVEI